MEIGQRMLNGSHAFLPIVPTFSSHVPVRPDVDLNFDQLGEAILDLDRVQAMQIEDIWVVECSMVLKTIDGDSDRLEHGWVFFHDVCDWLSQVLMQLQRRSPRWSRIDRPQSHDRGPARWSLRCATRGL